MAISTTPAATTWLPAALSAGLPARPRSRTHML